MSLVRLARSIRPCRALGLRSFYPPPPRQFRPLAPRPILRPFHTTPPNRAPIIPLPAILSLVKSGKLLSLITWSSKASLSVLPYSILRGASRRTKYLIAVPVVGLGILVLVGLDKAPNTDRWRLVFLSEQEEHDLIEQEVNQILTSRFGLVAPEDHEWTRWVQQITDNIAAVSVDDIRMPVRTYEPNHNYKAEILCDASTLNATCYGRTIIIYDLMLAFLEYHEAMTAAVLSHEIAHALQRHFVEQHGFASLGLMLADISRGVLWFFTDAFGPFVNDKINEVLEGYINLQTETAYNRKLEQEADLVGLMLMAKAGYDPSYAIKVWEKMTELEAKVGSDAEAAGQEVLANAGIGMQLKEGDKMAMSTQSDLVTSMLAAWFGGSHPPSPERIVYLKEQLPKAYTLYEESLRINGQPKSFVPEVEPLVEEPMPWYHRLLAFIPLN